MTAPVEHFSGARVYALILSPVILVISAVSIVTGGDFILVIPLVGALMLGLLTPWRFAVRDDGLELRFPLRRRIVMAKADVTVWVMRPRRAIAFLGERPRIGRYFPLPVPRSDGRFEDVLSAQGYHVIHEPPSRG